MRNRIILLLLAVLAFSGLRAQQDPQYSQYMFNGLLLNPAYAGSRDVLSASVLYRKQWVGLEGSPQTNTFSVHAPTRNDQHGLGFTLYHDRLGISRQINLNLCYAFRFTLGPGTMSLGLQGGFLNYMNRWSDAITVSHDNGLPQNNVSAFIPTAGTGAYYYTHRFYAGVSVPNLIRNKYQNPNTVSANVAARQERHIFGTAGVVLKLSDDIDFKPSLVVKYVKNAPVEFDFNAAMLFKQMFWVGASYRTGDAVVFILEYIHKNMFRFGYAYDVTTTKLSGYNSGSHELMLGLEMGWNKTRIKTPRYF